MISDHVVDLETSKNLAPYLAGYKSIKEWVWFKYDGWHVCDAGKHKTGHKLNPDVYPALILSEVRNLLPKHVRHKGKAYNRLISTIGDYDDITYYNWGRCYAEDSRDLMEQEEINHAGFSETKTQNMATAAAKLLLYLHENGYMEGK